MKEERQIMWALRMSKTEKQMLREIAEKEGVSMSAMVRLLVRRSHSRWLRVSQKHRGL